MNKAKERNSSVQVPVNESFKHDLSHRHTTTLDFFRLQPILYQEMIPGDKMSVDLRTIVQSAPLATQVFGGCHLDLHAFFVPNRLVYADWDNYILGNNRSAQQSYTLPYVNAYDMSLATGTQQGLNDNNYKEIRRIFSSLGYPAHLKPREGIYTSQRYSAIPARCYQKIWWDYYRDSVNIPESSKSSYLSTSGGSVQVSSLFKSRYRTFKKDFVSTLLTSPQLGSASSVSSHIDLQYVTHVQDAEIENMAYLGGTYNQFVLGESSTFTGSSYQLVNSISVPVLRGAIAMQRYLERLNVTGTRAMERLMSVFGVRPSAERLQMAEFLGGHTVKVNIDGLVNSGSNEQVSSIAESGYVNAWGIDNSGGQFGNHFGQGYQSGYGVGSGQTDKINYTASEYGYLVVIASLIPEYVNPNAVNRSFIRGLSTPDSSREDFFLPDFDGLGYQEMLLSEVATPGMADELWNPDADWQGSFDPFQVVGYQPKYEDYRFVQDRLSGDFLEKDSAIAMRNLVFSLNYTEMLRPQQMRAGLDLTTSNFAYRSMFDRHFQISSDSVDHFVCSIYVVNDCTRPVSNVQLPTELSDLANSKTLDVANGGVRI